MFSNISKNFLLFSIILLLIINNIYSACSYPQWSTNGTYNGGAQVTYDNSTWSAKWWTQGDIPGSSDVWDFVEICNDDTQLSVEDTLIYNGPGDTLTIKTKYNAMLLFYNPEVIFNNQTKKASEHWNNADTLANKYIRELHKATSGMVDWTIKYRYELDSFPPDVDPNFDFNATNIFSGKEVEGDYNAILLNPEYDIINRINSGEIDAVFLMSPPHTVFSETAMAGAGAYPVNGKTFSHIPTNKRFVVYGFNYERDVDCMLENTGHMAEWIMGRKIFKLNEAPKKHLVNTFQSSDLSSPTTTLHDRYLDDWLYFYSPELTNYDFYDGKCNAYGDAQVGNVHFSPNAHKNYSWKGCTQDFNVTSEEWKTFGADSWRRVNNKFVGSGNPSKSLIYDFGWVWRNGGYELDHTNPYIMKHFEGSFNINLTNNTTNGDAGFIFNATEYTTLTNSGNGYYIGLNADEDKLFLAEINNSIKTIVAEKNITIDYNVDYTINIKVDENLIEIRLGDELVPSISYTNKLFEYGCVGFAINGTNATFDNLDLDPFAYSSADNWYNYPDISGEKRKITGEEWDRNQEKYFHWWFEHLPKAPGFHNDTDVITNQVTSGILNNWLAYIFDINTFDTIGYYGAVRFPKPDVEAPAAPINVASSLNGNIVNLSWDEPTDNIGVTRYEIYRNDTLILITPNKHYSEKLFTTANTIKYDIAARDAGANVSSKTSTTLTINTVGTLVVARNVSPEHGTVTGSGDILVGVPSQISASPANSNYRFVNWVIETPNVIVADLNSSTTTATLTNNDQTAAVTAIFEEVIGCSIAPWIATEIYNANDVVCHNSSHWRAKWWTTGKEPGTTGEWGEWELISTCGQ